MTSKISYSKLAKENLRHRTAPAIGVLFAFLFQILTFIMQLQNECNHQGLQYKEIHKNITASSAPNIFMGLFTVAIAALLAFTGFHYLHVKTQVDFYHSLPVKRSTLFQVILGNSLLIFAVPLCISSVIECIIVAVLGHFSIAFVANLCSALLCYLVIFFVTYFTASLAMIMTGHTFVGFLGFGVFCTYLPLLIRYLFPSYAGTFFHTFSGEGTFGNCFNYFSPISLTFGLTLGTGSWSWKAHGVYFAVMCAGAVLLGLLSYFLFLKRPSEMATKAMAFPKANAVIRILLVIPLSLYAGIYFYSMALSSSRLWLIIGIVLGAFLFHGIIECIYQFDIHGLLSFKKQMVFCMIGGLLILSAFWTDLFGYDTYLPKKEEVASISLENVSSDNRYHFWGEKWGTGLTGNQIDETLALLQEIIRTNSGQSAVEDSTENSDAVAYSTTVFGVTVQSDLLTENHDTIQVTYQLKNGSVKIRSYVLSSAAQEELLNKLYATETFKKGLYSLYTADWEDITKVDWEDALGYAQTSLSKEEREEFFHIYLDEFSSFTYSELRNICPTAKFTITHKTPNDYGNTDDSYYIYPSFTKSLAYLSQHGLNLNQIGDCEITHLNITKYAKDSDEEKNYTITDPAILTSVKSNLFFMDFAENSGYKAWDSSVELEIFLKTKTGELAKVNGVTDPETAEKLE